MSWLDGLIPISAVVFGAIAALAVSLVEYRGANEERADAMGHIKWTRKHPIRPLLASVCTAALAAGAAAEFTTANFGPHAQNHPVLVGALTGAALLGITVLVIEALLQRVAARSWQPSLEATWGAVVKGRAPRGGRHRRGSWRQAAPRHRGHPAQIRHPEGQAGLRGRQQGPVRDWVACGPCLACRLRRGTVGAGRRAPRSVYGSGRPSARP
jgi:hypothetical protein